MPLIYFFNRGALSNILHYITLLCASGLPVTGCAVSHIAETIEDETDRKDEPGRDILLVIAGGEGYVDFRRGIELTFFDFLYFIIIVII